MNIIILFKYYSTFPEYIMYMKILFYMYRLENMFTNFIKYVTILLGHSVLKVNDDDIYF